MKKIAKLVLDQYDDQDGVILRSEIRHPDQVPDFIKRASRDLSNRTDSDFALIMLNDGKKMRKFATFDKGNTALSAIYFMKNASLLPPEVVPVTARKLVDACILHDIVPPGPLVKMAEEVSDSDDDWGVSGQSQLPYYPGAEVLNDKPAKPSKKKGKTRTLEDLEDTDLAQRTNMRGVSGTNYFKTPIFTTKERPEMRKEAEYFDVSTWEPSIEKAARKGGEYLLNGRYPVNTYGQVKQAAEYFEKNWREFSPQERREYCLNLAHKMDELGIPLTEKVASYSGEKYSPQLEAYIDFRKQRVADEFHEVLDTLMEKRAYVSPTTFASALEEFDIETGLCWDWDATVPDPWVSTFSVKTASDTYTFDANGVRVGEDELRDLALNGRSFVIQQFGEVFAEEFSKDPITFFKALPLPNKIVLARLAADRNLSAVTS